MKRRSGSLDGLRGFAAIAVVYMHVVVHVGLLPFAPLGAMGVLVFFGLSGYLISAICWRTESSLQGYRAFLRRRLTRLAPVILALFAVGVPALVTLGHLPWRDVLRDGILALTQTTAFATASGVDTHPSLAPTWSLTVEWVYYLVFPLVLLLLRRRLTSEQAALKALTAITVFLFLVGLLLPPRQYYLLPVANLAVLFAGGSLATWHHLSGTRERRADEGWTATALLLLTILVFLPGHTLGWGWKAVVLPATTVGTLLVIHGCWASSRVSALLGVRALRAVGLRAYSVYLWHMPVMWLVWVNLPVTPPLLRAAIALALVAIVSSASFHFLERPVLGLRRTTEDPQAGLTERGHRPAPAAAVSLRERSTQTSREGL